jgi:FKBP-type peptidyl-prolyl cis-trans isomerase
MQCVMILSAILLFPASVYAAEESAAREPVTLETEIDKISYVIGTQAGQSFKTQGLELNMDLFVRALKDALAGQEPAMSPEEMRQVMLEYRKRARAKRQAKLKKEAEENLVKGKAFIEENKTKPGVQALPSGLQYKVLKDGTGRTPTENDFVKAHYRGTLIDGTEFDSSYKKDKPSEFAVKGVIAGWTEALLLMKEGAKWQLFIPSELAYKKRGKGPVPGNAALIFDVELVEVLDKKPASSPSKAPQIRRVR